jgi:formylglycine-generating enzyme required for sulfatase activity
MSPEAQTSDWVEREILLSERTRKPIFPVLFEGEAWARLGNIQYDDMTAGMKAVLSERFINGLALYAPRHTGEAAPPPLPGEPLTTGVQPPLPVRSQPAFPLWRVALLAVLLLGGGALALGLLNSGALQSPTPTAVIAPTMAIAAAISPTPAPTRTLRPTSTPVPTLDATQIEASITAEMALIALGETATIIFNQTATALRWTPVPTADVRATAQARATEARAAQDAAQTATQAVFDATATVEAYTDTPTPTPTYTLTPSPSPTSTPDPLQAALALARTGVTRNDDWAPFSHTFPDDPLNTVMMLVPAGTFTMGSSDAEIVAAVGLCQDAAAPGVDCPRSWYNDEQPAHPQTVAAFWLDRTEVSRADYAACMSAGSCTETPDSDFSTQPEQPINRVSWQQANEFCAWRGAQLPTEPQWEFAARGPDGLIFPWGNTSDGTEANHCDGNCGRASWSANYQYVHEDHDDGYAVTAPVDSYPQGASWIGALNLVGNLWEWTSSLYGDYPYVAAREDENNSSNARVVRGGSFINSMGFVRAAYRNVLIIRVYYLIGFRCARLP